MSQASTLPAEIQEHIRLYREDPEKAHLWDSTPLGGPGILTTLLLTTRGRKSGEPRSLPSCISRWETTSLSSRRRRARRATPLGI